MSRLLPHPALSFLLTLIWLALTQLSLGNLFLGAVVGLIAGWAFRPLDLAMPRLRRPGALLRLVGTVFVDIIRSNLSVAWLIATDGRHGQRKSAFIEVPLRMRDPSLLAILALIITATPGSAWLEHDAETGILLLHVFDNIGEAEWRDLICNRYEARLMEAFA